MIMSHISDNDRKGWDTTPAKVIVFIKEWLYNSCKSYCVHKRMVISHISDNDRKGWDTTLAKVIVFIKE